MNKKYIPIIALLAALLFFYWVKTNQRGEGSTSRKEAGELLQLDRSPSKIIYSKHAQCRMDCRHIDESEVKAILLDGRLNKAKMETSSKGTTYPLEGTTADGQRVRIVFAPKEDGTSVVVTVIDLDKEYECECG